jgi:type II secretory pathway pseudopilin PulG
MKMLSFKRRDSRRTGVVGFTVAEMLIAMTIFSMAIAAMVATQLFGLRVYTLAATKLSATSGCRKALNSLRDQIREAKLVDIGNCGTNGDPASFSSLGMTNYQVGNAIRLTSYNNWTNSFTVFYQDTSLVTTNYLKQCTVQCTVTGGATNYTYSATNNLAMYITNSDIFTAQDYLGRTLTNEESVDNTLQAIPNRLVVYVKLQFYQWEYPIAFVGSNNAANMYDYYQLRTKVTRRAWN